MDTILQYPNGDLPNGYVCRSMQGMKPHEIRRKNLQALIDARFDGNKGQFADAIGRKRPLVYRLFSDAENSRRDIGEELARDIEHILRLPAGSLDAAETAPGDNAGNRATSMEIPAELAPLIDEITRAWLGRSLSTDLLSSMRSMVAAISAQQSGQISGTASQNSKMLTLGQRRQAVDINSGQASIQSDKNGDLDKS